jgi:pyridoxine 5-phosphate synthase
MAQRLGVNIDHIATLRNARGGIEPDPVEAMYLAAKNGADGITVHLREDRRHIRDEDVRQIRKLIPISLNLEMSIATEIVDLACELTPHQATIVPEKRQELTTEGGLNLFHETQKTAQAIERLQKAGVLVSLFIEADSPTIKTAAELGADFVEIHTGAYANQNGNAQKTELKKIEQAAAYALELGLGLNAGHGLNYHNVKPIAAIAAMDELNIGHAIIARAVFTGLGEAVQTMKSLITG